MRLWKWVGLAGVLGAVGVGGAVVVHRRRQREWDDDVDPEELRERLHRRLANAGGNGDGRVSGDRR